MKVFRIAQSSLGSSRTNPELFENKDQLFTTQKKFGLRLDSPPATWSSRDEKAADRTNTGEGLVVAILVQFKPYREDKTCGLMRNAIRIRLDDCMASSNAQIRLVCL